MESNMHKGDGIDNSIRARALNTVPHPQKTGPQKQKPAAVPLVKQVKYRELDPSIRDSDDDWLTRQLKEEEEAYYRTCDMFGISPHVSPATVLKAEHAVRHGVERMTQAYRR